MKSTRVYTVEGVVLKRRVSGEADRILTVFTKQKGKIRVLAKGIRRIHSRRAGHLEVFSRVILTLHTHGTLDIVSEASSLTHGVFFGDDPVRLAYAYCLAELVDQLLPEAQEHPDIFFLLTEALEKLVRDKEISDLQETTSAFVHELLWSLGFLPSTRSLSSDSMRLYIEHLTERKLRAWPPLKTLS